MQRPPALGRMLLKWLCPQQHLEVVRGDLEELYRARLDSEGPVRARVRYFVDIASLLRSRYNRFHRPPPDGRLAGSLPLAADTGPAGPDDRETTHYSRNRSAMPREVFVDKLAQDMRFAARGLAKSPAFAAVVILTLGLGIGANSTIFSVVNGVLLQPLSYPEPEEIVQIAEINPTTSAGEEGLASQTLFIEWRDDTTAFDGIAMYSNQAATLTGADEPIRLTGVAASPALFPLLGVDALNGRTFAPDEETPGNDRVILLSHRAWQRYFGGDPGTLGTQVRLDDIPRTVLGIMPAGFEFPDASVEFWIPMVIRPFGEEGGDPFAQPTQATAVTERREERRGPGAPGRGGPGAGPGPGGGEQVQRHIELWGRLVARLADGVTMERATEEGTALLRGVRETQPDAEEQPRVELTVLQEQLVGPIRSSLTMLMGAVGFVLLIACANVANLVLARSAGRHKETAVRAALGAGRMQLVRLLLAEGLMLALLGGTLGLGVAWGGVRVLRAIGPEFIPRLGNVAVDGWALSFTLLVSILTGVFFSLMPARGAAAVDLTRALKQDAASDGAARVLGRDLSRKLLVIAEVALSVVLLVGAGLLVSSFARLATIDPGYDAENLLNVQLQLPPSRYATPESYLGFFERTIVALEQVPGVESVTFANIPPSFETNMRLAMSISNNDPATPDRPPAEFGVRVVEPAYFETLRMERLGGRFLNRDDRAGNAPVMVVNASAARALFPDEDPVGQRFPLLGGQEFEVVGVVNDLRTAGVDPTTPAEVFLPLAHAPARMIPMLFRSVNLLVRTGPAPMTVLPAIRARMQQLDPEVPLYSAATMRDRISETVAAPRFYAALVTAFAALAVTLAAIGIYGLLSYSVQQRIRETAIRRALGARGGEILRTVVIQGMALAVVGLVVGIGAAVMLTRVLESMLYEVEPTDPVNLIVVTLVFLGVALSAILIPARRATKIDPMDALRYEG